MRPIKEILRIIKDNIKCNTEAWEKSKFMCILATQLYFDHIITEDECEEVRSYIGDNKPIGEEDFSGGWFPPLETAPRLKWLNDQIYGQQTKIKFTKNSILNLLKDKRDRAFNIPVYKEEYRDMNEAMRIIQQLTRNEDFPDN